MTYFKDLNAIHVGFWKWPHFTPKEIACKESGDLLVVPEFLDKIESLRVQCGFPFPVTSWFRTPDYNAKISNTGKTGPHTTGRAVDINVFGVSAISLLEKAVRGGFTGIGIKQTGPMTSRFIHLDDLSASDGQPRPWIWTY